MPRASHAATGIDMEITTGRPATLAARGMVACPHSLASSAGVDALRAGGSAVDAALAAAAALAVLYPHMTSAGGDAFWLIYDAKTKQVRYLDGGGRAPAAATVEAFRARGMSEIPFRGILPATVTVPGAVASLGSGAPDVWQAAACSATWKAAITLLRARAFRSAHDCQTGSNSTSTEVEAISPDWAKNLPAGWCNAAARRQQTRQPASRAYPGCRGARRRGRFLRRCSGR